MRYSPWMLAALAVTPLLALADAGHAQTPLEVRLTHLTAPPRAVADTATPRPPALQDREVPSATTAFMLTALGSVGGMVAGAFVGGHATNELGGLVLGGIVGSFAVGGIAGAATTEHPPAAVVGSALGVVAGSAMAAAVDGDGDGTGLVAYLATHALVTVVFGNGVR